MLIEKHKDNKLDNLNVINSLGLFFTDTNEELDVIVDNIDSLDDEDLCKQYGLDYDQVNCIELA